LSVDLDCNEQRVELLRMAEEMSGDACVKLLDEVDILDAAAGVQSNATSAAAIAHVEDTLGMTTCPVADNPELPDPAPSPVPLIEGISRPQAGAVGRSNTPVPAPSRDGTRTNSGVVIATACGIIGAALLVALVLVLGHQHHSGEKEVSVPESAVPASPMAASANSFTTSDVDDQGGIDVVTGNALHAGAETGWTTHTDPSDGTPYYHNSITGQTQWELPTATTSTSKADRGQAGPEAVDEGRGGTTEATAI
jgi:hypothetical protein